MKTLDRLKIAASQNVKEKEYWMRKLAGQLEPGRFPRKYSEKDEIKRQIETLPFTLTGELQEKLKQLSAGKHQTLYVILAAALAALLQKYSGSNEILIAGPIFERENEGEYINTVLPLRTTVTGKMTFKELLKQTRQTLLEANKHQNYPIDQLIDRLEIGTPAGDDHPLFDTGILMENIQNERNLSHLPLNTLYIFDQKENKIEGKIRYNTAIYEKNTVKQQVTHYTRLLETAAAHLEKPLHEIEILSAEEKKQLLYGCNETQEEYPQKTIVAMFEEQVERTPRKIAVVDLAQGKEERTYEELNDEVNRQAAFYKEKGIKPGTIAALLLKPSIKMVTAVLAVLKAGGAYLPIDTSYPPNRILSILEESGAVLVITGTEIAGTISFMALENIKNKEIKPEVTPPRPQIVDFDSMPIPDRTLVPYEKYHKNIGIALAKHTVSIQATRGCPYNCLYCHKIWPKKHVVRSAENIFDEITRCYEAGARRIVFIDDIFNLDKKNSARLLQKIIDSPMELQLFFPNGLRGDILTKEFIDLMIEAGTVNMDLALESASPRIQKLLNKNLDLEKFRENVKYITEKHPHVILEMEMMHGFPTETEEEAL
ncbi:MAG: AMP-binding protein, partial [bacterium]|nr:AMP-binding protein [bacterium]